MMAVFVLLGCASPRPAPEPTRGRLSNEQLLAPIIDSRDRIRACHERLLQENPSLRGMVTVQFVIGREGRVEDSRVLQDASGDRRLGACVAGEVASIRFPEPEGGPVKVEFPFHFSAPEDDQAEP
ncbi:MAG: AgmX/PglI C-terminal domain-containing protein [Myxococcota bacterium]